MIIVSMIGGIVNHDSVRDRLLLSCLFLLHVYFLCQCFNVLLMRKCSLLHQNGCNIIEYYSFYWQSNDVALVVDCFLTLAVNWCTERNMSKQDITVTMLR